MSSGKTLGIAAGVVITIFMLIIMFITSMGNIHHRLMFPAPLPSYTLKTAHSIQMIHGVPTLWNSVNRSRGFLLYLHANAVDIGMIRGTVHALSRDTQLTVLAPEYPGYGIFPGPPSPLGAISAARRVYEYIQENKRPGDIAVVMGRSIGTGVAGQMLQKISSDGTAHLPDKVVLLSPFASIEHVGHRLAGDLGKMVCKDVYHTLDAVKTISVPLLIIVGSEDTLTPPEDAHAIHDASASTQKSLKILPGSDHNALDWSAINTHVREFTRM